MLSRYSWSDRGWCRAERMARELSSEGLVILVQNSTQLPGRALRVCGGHCVVNEEKHDSKYQPVLRYMRNFWPVPVGNIGSNAYCAMQFHLFLRTYYLSHHRPSSNSHIVNSSYGYGPMAATDCHMLTAQIVNSVGTLVPQFSPIMSRY